MTVLKNRADKAASLIESGFMWSKTIQGHAYWEAVVTQLREIQEIEGERA